MATGYPSGGDGGGGTALAEHVAETAEADDVHGARTYTDAQIALLEAAVETKQDAATAATDAELAAGLATKQGTSEKAQANGYASLDGGGKVPATQLPNSVMELQGAWNAATNTPALVDGTGNPGDVYRVSNAGTQDLGSGPINFKVNDTVLYGADGKWFRSRATDEVLTVFGRNGDVVAQSGDYSVGQVTGAAPLADPIFTGNPQAPDRADGDNDQSIANTKFVQTAAGLLIPKTAIETDAALPSNSDTNVPSSKAMKTALATKRSLSKWRPLGHKVAGTFSTSLSGDTKYFLVAGTTAQAGISISTVGQNVAQLFDLKRTDHDEAGLTTKLLLRARLAIGTSPARSIRFGLWVPSWGSSIGFSSLVPSSEVTISTALVGSDTTGGEVEFDAPATGVYVISVEALLGSASAAFHAEAELFVRNAA